MSRGVIPTHAGDDSDGKIWGIEGMNILFLLASGMIGLGLALMLSHGHSPAAVSYTHLTLPTILRV